jgi:hypothetical protein
VHTNYATEGWSMKSALSEHCFLSLRHAPQVIEAWRQEYNELPHSSLGIKRRSNLQHDF